MKIFSLTVCILSFSLLMPIDTYADQDIRTVMYEPGRVDMYAHNYRLNRISRIKRRYCGYLAAVGLIAGGYMAYKKLFHPTEAMVAPLHVAETPKAKGSFMSVIRSIGRIGKGLLLFLMQHTCVELCAIPLANMFMKPIENSIRDECIVARAGCWFLDEQIPDKRLPHAVVGFDLYDLVQLIMRIEVCVQQIAEVAQVHEVYMRRRVLNEQSLVLSDLCEQLQGAVNSLDQVLSGAEQEVLHTAYHTIGLRLMGGIQLQYEAILAHIHASPEEWSAAVNTALGLWNTSYKIAIRPLMHVSCYRVRPWPLWEGTMNCMRSLMIRTMIMN